FLKALVVAWVACGCMLVVFGDNLDPAAPHEMGPNYAVVYSKLTPERKATIGLEMFGLGDEGFAASRSLMLVARQGTEVVAAYLLPGKYELGGLQLETRGGNSLSTIFKRHQRDEYAYFGIDAGTCNWIGDYVVDASVMRGARVTQLTDESSFAAASAVFKERFADLAGRCSLRNALIER
ncbi:MAG: hypothetical protein JRF63_05690, partial [Deltaproteobacteria bacterium]|nr:hypothetical protein [Deltaproteobacteria bacterium]